MNSISTCMIVKDEKDNILRSLESAIKFSSEVIVTDTGSTDGTVEIIKDFIKSNKEVKLHHFKWNNNFSEARNYSISKCTQDYIFILDADEELSEEAVNNINNMTLDKEVYSLTTANFLDLEKTLYDTIVQARLFKRGNISYSGVVHNQSVYKGKPEKIEGILNHYGYAWTDELREKKYNRTATLLRQEIDKYTGTNKKYFQVQLFKSMLIGKKLKEARDFGYSLAKEFLESNELPALAYEYFTLYGMMLAETKEFELADMCFRKAKSMYPTCADAYLGAALILLAQNYIIAGIYEIELFYKFIDNTDFIFTAAGRKYEGIADVVSASLYLKSGDIEKAKLHLKKLNNLNPRYDTGNYLDTLLRTIISQVCDENIQKIWGELMELYKDKKVDLSILDYDRLYKKGIELSPIKKRLVFICQVGLEHFVKPIREAFSKEYTTKLITPQSTDEIKKALNYGDIIWLEWGNDISIACANEGINKPTIMRVLSYEAYLQILKQLNWKNVNKVIFVADFIADIVKSNYPVGDHVIINNGVNLDKFTFRNQPKNKNVAFVGNFNGTKQPDLFLQIAHKVIKEDKDYKFFWKGQIQDTRLYHYFRMMITKLGLENNVFYENHSDNVNEWLEDKSIFLSTSGHEAYGMAILEAFAKGLKPVIHNFYYAEEFYPKEYLFNTIDEGAKMILDSSYTPELYRKFAEEHSFSKQIEETRKVINSFNL